MADDRSVLLFPEARETSASVVHAEAAEVVRLELYRVTHAVLPEPRGQSNMAEPPPIPPIETAATIAKVPMPDLFGPRFTFAPVADAKAPYKVEIGSGRSLPLVASSSAKDRKALRHLLTQFDAEMEAIDDALVEVRRRLKNWRKKLKEDLDE
ncbi:hypothetical protein A3C20_00730 [Candidatus Kaiserbacteria bacterium RIFCSPHIGHO2_02_FULL_55_25]|uniref:Uncharacterized protein n=1 Tax=Candidatus Kaiserbacteria bacterium RIFCSPHIGHO2_02_FULL_55_25 TaxID=1798498 RepID=A0A1F6E752_9BACT|nr:MAG: hypothetical protein A2764_01005 [Candidatus Kaiserbacteria bacterium RIFCSPHIGHO2_01_FULL_55_79]OGG69476.1 MAG: hypothetical protein A3C20_00730 [Candidatus Kaiserbacteria bacterium RIFCSPHIGHO2_02_FULL_55_25]OGG77381.1 MAG: hypothetical protein A3F56_03815 [Candidatus Kaiserbacteria bacterium RIFCSPHIGHO2_12_FULL_55_13]OGG83075.1 MAG: hypothetical protein A3A42_04650 [Candidatus Kaiserbacteria bacterium RIFCSPLOWO2_01_FULL_55_25]